MSDPIALNPRRYPLVMVDRVVEHSARKLTARKCVTANELHFLGHFPGRPVMPGVLMVEALAQAAIILSRASGELTPASRLLEVQKMRFRQMVLPGDVLELQVEHEADQKYRVEGLVDGNTVCEGVLRLI